MPRISSDSHTVTMLDTSHAANADRTDLSHRVLRKPVPANDNFPPLLTTPFSDENLVSRSDSSNAAEEKAMIVAFGLVAVLIFIAWVYALSLPATVKIDEWRKSALPLSFRAAAGK